MNFNVANPETTEELLDLISEHQDNNFRFGAGCTDLLIELKKQPDENLTVINLTRLTDDYFTSIAECEDGIRIGSLTTAGSITFNKKIQTRS